MPHEPASGSLCCDPVLSEDYISRGPLLPVTLLLFLPLAFSMMLSSTVGLVDMYIASFLGSAAQAAVGLGDQLLFLVIVLGSGLATACSSFVSRAAGAKDFGACRLYAQASLLLAVLIGLLATVLGVYCARPILALLGASAEVAALAEPYTIFNALANTPFVVSLCLSAIFRSLGKTRLSVWLWFITAFLANLISAFVFFSGLDRSLNALAIGWDLGALIGCLCGLYLYKKESGSLMSVAGSPAHGRIPISSVKAMKDLLKIGAPAVLSELSLVLSHFLMYRIFACSADSATLQAAWTVKLKLEEMFGLIPLMALGMATAVIVGQSIGAQQRERAIKAATRIAACSAAAMLLVGAIMTLAAQPLAELFCNDAACREAIVALLEPSMVLMPLTALGSIICAALEGAGLTQLPMRLNIAFQVFGRASLAYLFGILLCMGLQGVGLGLCLAQGLMLVALALWAARAARRHRGVCHMA